MAGDRPIAPPTAEELAGAAELPLREALGRLLRTVLGPGLAVGLAAMVVLGAARLPGHAPADLAPAEAAIAPDLPSRIHAELVLAPAWKARGIGEAIAPASEAALPHAVAMAGVEAILARGWEAGATPASADAQSFLDWGRTEAEMGLWSLERLEDWAEAIVALDGELPRAIGAAQTRMMEAGLRPSLAGPLAHRLALDLALEARGVEPGQRGRAPAEVLFDLAPTDTPAVRAAQDDMRLHLLPRLAAVLASVEPAGPDDIASP